MSVAFCTRFVVGNEENDQMTVDDARYQICVGRSGFNFTLNIINFSFVHALLSRREYV